VSATAFWLRSTASAESARNAASVSRRRGRSTSHASPNPAIKHKTGIMFCMGPLQQYSIDAAVFVIFRCSGRRCAVGILQELDEVLLRTVEKLLHQHAERGAPDRIARLLGSIDERPSRLVAGQLSLPNQPVEYGHDRRIGQRPGFRHHALYLAD